MKKLMIGLLSILMSLGLMTPSMISISAAPKAITITYGTAYDKNGDDVTILENGEEFTVEAAEIDGMKFNSWAYKGRVKFDDKKAEKTTVQMGTKDTHIWANYSLIEPVWLNGVYLKPGYYLPSNSQDLTKTKPETGGYAYYASEGYLTLHNYQLDMMAPTLDSCVTENYRYALRTFIPLVIQLEGDNSIKMINGDCVYVAIGGASGSYLTFEGDEDATLYVASGEDVGIRSIGGVTINGGNIVTRGLSSDRSSDIIMNGGSFISQDIMTGHCNQFIVNAGSVNVEALYNITNVVVNGGSMTGSIFERVYNMKKASGVEGLASPSADGKNPIEFRIGDFNSYNWFSVSGASADLGKTYNISIENGFSSAQKATAGTRVIIKAETPAPGYVFDQWVVSDNVVVGAPFSDSTKFIMPAGDVTIKATYKRDLDVVRNIKAEQQNYSTVLLTWNAVEGAKTYNIYRKTEASEEYVLHGSSKTNSFKATQKTGKDYKYKVTAVDGTVEGKLSEFITAITQLEGKPTLTLEKSGKTKFVLNWSEIDGATRYIIYRKRGKDSFKKVLTLGKDDFTYTTSEMPEGDYSYIVKAGRYDSKDRIMTDSSNIVSGTSVYDTPVLKATAGSKKATLSWQKIEGVIYYDVYQSTDGKNFTKVTTTKSTNVTIDKLKSGKKYTFKVCGYKAYNGTNIYTKDSNTKAVTIK